MRRPLKKTAQASGKAAASLKANKLDAAMPDLLKADQTLKETFDIAKRELGVLEQLWLFQQASSDLKLIRLTIEDIEAEQADMRGDVESARKDARTALDLAGPQAMLARATQQVQDSVAAIREAGSMTEPLDAAIAAMTQAAAELGKDQAPAVSLDHWMDFTKASPGGKAIQGHKAEWNSLIDRERAALNENFARELPLEFRKLLKDYYEALSK